MILTPELLELDARTRDLFRRDRGWQHWGIDNPSRRDPARPDVLAMHLPTRALLAVWVRPRPLRGSDKTPLALAAPEGAACVAWWPSVRGRAETWVRAPFTDPPGLFASTWSATGGVR